MTPGERQQHLILERKRRARERRRRCERCYTFVASDLLPDALRDIGALEDPEDEAQVAEAIAKVILLALPAAWRELIEGRVQAPDSENG